MVTSLQNYKIHQKFYLHEDELKKIVVVVGEGNKIFTIDGIAYEIIMLIHKTPQSISSLYELLFEKYPDNRLKGDIEKLFDQLTKEGILVQC